MWWLLNQPTQDAVLEVNPQELKKFILQEALFLEQMDKMLSEAFSFPNWVSGKSLAMVSQVFMEAILHLRDNALYFMPKEMKE